MLSVPDSEVVSRDPALPGLGLVLDPAALLETLTQRLPRIPPASAAARYVRYKPGTSCQVLLRLEAAQGPVELSAKAHHQGAFDKMQKAAARPAVGGPFGPGRLVLADRGVVVSFFPNDAALPSLGRLAVPAHRCGLLRKLLPDRPDLWQAAPETLRYKPERRLVARLGSPNGNQAVLRMYSQAAWRAATNGAMASERGFRTARRLGRSNRHRALVMEWLPGRVLGDLLRESPEQAGDALVRVGAALADFQMPGNRLLRSRLCKGLWPLLRRREAAALWAAAEGVAAVCPHLAARCRSLARPLARSLRHAPQLLYPLHGDFYAQQVVLDGARLALVDYDKAALGDPAADLGNFLAHLHWQVLQSGHDTAEARRLTEALLEGYLNVARRRPARLDLYTAAALLRLAPHPFRTRLPDWPLWIERIVERAESLLQPIRSARSPKTPSRRRPGRRLSTAGARVVDRFDLTADPPMAFLAPSLNPAEASRQFQRWLPGVLEQHRVIGLQAIRVVRHKPGRRCLIEYDLRTDSRWPNGDSRAPLLTLVGKSRSKGLDFRSYHLQEALWNGDFGSASADGISVPEPVGVVPEWQMWFQHKVGGETVTQLLPESGGAALANRVAEAAWKLHAAGIPSHRRHTIADELAILHKRLGRVMDARPDWSRRIRRILDASGELADALCHSPARGIHRDFYADQLMVDDRRLYLVDMDLYCEGDPALDIGNFCGHLIELGLRQFGDPNAFSRQAAALQQRYLKLCGEDRHPAIRTYTTLTLARHIDLSMRLPGRTAFVETIIERCEQRLRSDTGCGQV